MSTELKANGPLALTRFYGGRTRGTCVQLTRRSGDRDGIEWRDNGAYEGLYTSVRIKDIPALIADLQAIADGTIEADE